MPSRHQVATASRHQQPWRSDEEYLLTTLWDEGMKLHTISRRLGRTKDACALRAKQLGCKPRQQKLDREVLRGLYAMGEPDREIAKWCRCTRDQAAHVRRELALGPPHRAKPRHDPKKLAKGQAARRLTLAAQSEVLWPGCSASRGEVRVLDALALLDRPVTIQELVAAMPWTRPDKGGLARYHYARQILLRLEVRGLVQWLGRETGERNSHPSTWRLDGQALEVAERRKQERDLE